MQITCIIPKYFIVSGCLTFLTFNYMTNPDRLSPQTSPEKEPVSFARVTLIIALFGSAAITATIVGGRSHKTKAEQNAGTKITALKDDEHGHKTVRVVDRFVPDGKDDIAKESDIKTKIIGQFLAANEVVVTYNVESFKNPRFWGANEMILTADTTAKAQWDLEQTAKTEKEISETKPAEIKEDPKGIFTFRIDNQPQYNVALDKTIKQFSTEHPGVGFAFGAAPVCDRKSIVFGVLSGWNEHTTIRSIGECYQIVVIPKPPEKK